MASIMDRIEELEGMGFKRWQKNGMDRMYVDAARIGLDADANMFQGKRISGSLVRAMKGAKTYIDLVNGEIHSDNTMLAASVADLMGVDYRFGENTIKM